MLDLSLGDLTRFLSDSAKDPRRPGSESVMESAMAIC